MDLRDETEVFYHWKITRWNNVPTFNEPVSVSSFHFPPEHFIESFCCSFWGIILLGFFLPLSLLATLNQGQGKMVMCLVYIFFMREEEASEESRMCHKSRILRGKILEAVFMFLILYYHHHRDQPPYNNIQNTICILCTIKKKEHSRVATRLHPLSTFSRRNDLSDETRHESKLYWPYFFCEDSIF